MLLAEFSPIAAIATTSTAAKKLQSLSEISTIWLPDSLTDVAEAQFYTGSLKTHLASLWNTHRAFVFCLATGAVVRLIAPLLQHKSSDPAVVVIDEAGKFQDETWLPRGELNHTWYYIHLISWLVIVLAIAIHLLMSAKVGGLPLILSMFDKNYRPVDSPTVWFQKIGSWLRRPTL